MMRAATATRTLVAGLAIAVAIAGVVVAAPDPDRATAWSPVVYPMQRLPLTFSHAQHLGRGTPCAACHAAATSSRSAVDNLLPTEAACRACHPIDRAQPALVRPGQPPVACLACHPGFTPDAPVARVYLTPPPLKFDHSAHRAAPCETCHGDLRAVGLATTQHLPTMAACLRCHTNGGEERHCADCHLAQLGGLIETRFDQGMLVPAHDGLGDAHGLDFKNHHTQEARQIGATCGACHDRSECVACHQGVVKPMDFHPGNYLVTHAVDARRGKPDCSACHRAQSFCVGCHERSGLGTRGDTQFSSTDPERAFHPPGWASAGPGPNRHAREARRNVTSCASCHREDECLTCHSAQPGALHASPHPSGWRGSARCKALDRGNRRMCLRCHITQDETGCDWSAR
jgi:Cytochrome c7 and related cytochrome c